MQGLLGSPKINEGVAIKDKIKAKSKLGFYNPFIKKKKVKQKLSALLE